MNKASIHIYVQDFCGYKFATPLGKKLWDTMIRLCLVLQEPIKMISKMTVPFYIYAINM